MEKNVPFTPRLFRWLDNNLLTYLAGFLLIFIPLYPKIPLADIIPGYIVRIRLEDFFIALTLLVWGIQLIRKKATLHPLITKFVIAYAIIGLLSTVSAILITKTVPLSDIHIMKVFLHYFRRLEYFSLFFIFYSAVKSIKTAKIFLILYTLVLLGVSLYGYGQKYLYWPVYSTMNREFSKGWKLYLTEHARVPSTFGGHYDAAAFVMVALIIVLAIFFFTKWWWLKLLTGIAFLTGLWLLILTASRTSFIGYLGGVSVLMFFALFIKGFKWVIPRYVGVMALSLFIMLSFGDLAERYSQVLGLDAVRDKFKSVLFSQKAQKPADFDEVTQVVVPSDTTPVTEKPTDELPADVHERIPIPVPEVDENGNFTGNYINVSRTYSDNAYKYGLSAAIRFDALWPRAIAGFKKNPLLGSGYSTLTKETVGQFTEAESTDNDFLRNLGETGLLGFTAFFGTIAAVCFAALKLFKHISDPLVKAFTLAFIAATVGLLLNAVYIDVFESSKVAQTYWALAGLLLATISLKKPATHSKSALQ